MIPWRGETCSIDLEGAGRGLLQILARGLGGEVGRNPSGRFVLQGTAIL